MLLSEERFFAETLNVGEPALARASALYAAGEKTAARAAFVAHLREVLMPATYFKIPYYPRENAWTRSGETDAEACERILRGTLIACGTPCDFGDAVDYTANPTYNGYKEWTWQLSRHHEFRCLAKVYRDTGDERYAAGFARLMRTWLLQAPCPENESGYATLCWRTIEAGIRTVKNWHYAIHAFLFSPSVDDALWVDVFRSLWEHAYRLENASTHGNWLVMEMSGLAHIGLLYPRVFRDADGWFARAVERLSDEIDVQVYPDGFQYELSTGYHGVVLMNYLFLVDLAAAFERPLPEKFMANLHRLYDLYPKLLRPTGRTPDLNDGGKVSAKEKCREGLVYYPGDPVFTYFATDGKEGTAPDYTSILLPYSGFAVMRTGWSKDAIFALLDGGPFGAGHQHEDKLNFLLSAYGVDLLDDTGNYEYDTSEMRKYVLSTRAHNTGLVDGFGQNRRKNYKIVPEAIARPAEELTFEIGEETEVARSTYNEGYGPDLIPVSHTRKVVFYKKGFAGSLPFFLLLDSFKAEDGESHRYEVSFQLGTEPVTVEKNSLRTVHKGGVALDMIGDDCPSVYVGRYAPFMGWRPIRASGPHEHAPAPVVSFEKSGAEAAFATLLYPSPDGAAHGFSLRLEGGEAVLTRGGETLKIAF